MKIEFSRHNIDDADIDRVKKVLKSIFLTTGDVVGEFETSFSKYLGLSNTVAVTSCSAALHLSLLAWGIGEGDEVITTPLSFCATSNAILHVNALPVFVDVEEETGNINAELIESKITKKTKAIIPVHLYGQMCDMNKIKQIAEKYKLIIIEDAAHCIEGMRNGVRVGKLSDLACFSFYATKNITSGEGGAIVTNNSEKAKILKMLRLHGIDKPPVDRYLKKFQHWDMQILGWKYNMSNIQAALLIGQLKRIEDLWERRDLIWKKYESAFERNKKIKLLKTVPNSKHARHLFTIQVPENKRDSLIFSLQKKGIGITVNYRPIHLLRFYRGKFGFKEGDFPVAENIGKKTISLPLYPALKDSEVEYIINVVLEEIEII
jgi:dTDP-4-amino-4,6-dideoxygalactose transaminase